MKGVSNRKRVAQIIFVLILISVEAPVLVGFSVPKATEITEVVSYPLPSFPEPVLLEGALRVEVKAGSDASEWTASLSSRFGSASMELINSSYTGDRWTLYFMAPGGLPPELYDLHISYQAGGSTVEYTQSRCIWLLEDWPETITISHISDIHMQHGRDFFAQYIHEVNMFDPDLIIATGDIVQTETVAAGWDYLQSQMKWIEVPSYLIPGNHDHAGGGSLIYQRYGGPLNYSVVIGDFLFIAVDSHLEGQEWSDQFQWLESELEKHSEKVKILAWHHPLLGFEIEDIEGTPSGFNITGSWEDLEQFNKIAYYGWMWGPDIVSSAFRDLLRVIQVYDVRLILHGHYHYDIIHILNNRHYFINVGPVGGGLPPGQYHGSRLITIDSAGNVALDEYATNNMRGWRNSIPIDGLTYWYSSANDWSESAVSATIKNDLMMNLTRARLDFHVSPEHSVDDYEFSTEPVEYETYTTDDGHIFVAYFFVPVDGKLDVTLSAAEDSEPPEISLDISDFQLGETMDGTITVTDSGWGVEEVEAFYTNDATETWTPIELPFSPTINGDVYDVTYPEALRSFTIPAEDVAPGLIVKVEAQDHAGNPVTYQTADLAAPPTHSFSVATEPSGISITVDGDGVTAPYTDELEEGTHTVSVPLEAEVSGKDYTFVEWEDGVSSSTRTVSLEGDTSLRAIYEEAQVEEPTEEEPEEPEEPSGPAWIPLPTSYVVLGLILGICVIYLLNKR